MTPITITAGYRGAPAAGLTPYVGAGVGWYQLEEEQLETTNAARIDTRHIGYHVVGGAEFPLLPFLWLAGEVQWATVPDAIGETGVSLAYDEDDLGGTTFRSQIEEVLHPDIGNALIVAADISILRCQSLAPRVVDTRCKALSKTLPQRRLPGCVQCVLRVVDVVSLAEIQVRPHAAHAVYLIKHTMQRILDASISYEGRLQHNRRRQ